MRKELALKRVLLGFIIGVFISYTLDIAFSMIVGNGIFYGGIENLDNEMSKLIIKYFASGIIGSVLGVSLWIFENEKWSIALQTFIHFLLAEITFIVYIIALSRNDFGISPIAFYQVIIILTYFIIWVLRTIYWNYQVKKIRRKMQEITDESFYQISRKMKINNLLLKGALGIVAIILIIILIFIYKNIVHKEISLLMMESTNLSDIKVDGAAINDKIETLNITNYTDTYDGDSGEYQYLFDEISIEVNDDNEITSLHSRFDEGKTTITINGISNLKTIDEVQQILGDNYYNGLYDWEQLLYSYVYYDKENEIIAEFVYLNFDEKSPNNRLLTWINIYKK